MTMAHPMAYATDVSHPVRGKVATYSRRSLPPSERRDAGPSIVILQSLRLSTAPAVSAGMRPV